MTSLPHFLSLDFTSIYPPHHTFRFPTFFNLEIMPAADARSEARVSNYTKFWQKDSAQDGANDKTIRLDKYTDLVNGYYDGATELYEYGWGEYMWS